MMMICNHIVGKGLTLALIILPTTTLSSCAQKVTPPIVAACVKLGSYAVTSSANSMASQCACFEATAKRQLDEGNYRALDKIAQIILEDSLSAKEQFIRKAMTAKVIEDTNVSDIPMTAADYAMLVHKFSDQCKTG
jgi:hypothetical protein